jgi:hypothetical protein
LTVAPWFSSELFRPPWLRSCRKKFGEGKLSFLTVSARLSLAESTHVEVMDEDARRFAP